MLLRLLGAVCSRHFNSCVLVLLGPRCYLFFFLFLSVFVFGVFIVLGDDNNSWCFCGVPFGLAVLCQTCFWPLYVFFNWYQSNSLPIISKLSELVKNTMIDGRSLQNLGVKQRSGSLVATSYGNTSVNELITSSSFVKLTNMDEEKWN